VIGPRALIVVGTAGSLSDMGGFRAAAADVREADADSRDRSRRPTGGAIGTPRRIALIETRGPTTSDAAEEIGPIAGCNGEDTRRRRR